MGLREDIEAKHSGDVKQLEFIFSTDKRIIVTAPAGCGKTTAMVSKIAWELSQGNVPRNKKILGMTFSVPAATKIKDAVNDLLPSLIGDCERELNKVEVANYHSFATKLLYKHGYLLNEELINLSEFQIIAEFNDILDSYLISSERNILNDFDTAVKNLNYDKVKRLISSYIDILQKKLFPNLVITYNGLLLCAIKLFDIDSIRKFYKQYFRIVIIDEFQDTNYLSFLFINKLIGNNKLFLLGDDIQKIYGFLGAMKNIFSAYAEQYEMREIEFLNNYRFAKNLKMKELDKFIRSYGTTYAPSTETAKINVNVFDSEVKEAESILEGTKKIISSSNDKVAILVRAGYQAKSIVDVFDDNNILYFNAIFNDNDQEYIRFHQTALKIINSITAGNKRIIKSVLEKCKREIKGYKSEICSNPKREFIFDSLYRLLDVLFTQSLNICHSSQERYERIAFILNNNSLKHMMEYIDDPVFITTIHSAKGLEWEYIIIPKMMCSQFPSYGGVCKLCIQHGSRNKGGNYCKFTFGKNMKRKFNEEISVFYVGITRAKKDVFITANTGTNSNGFHNQTSCLINLPGLTCEKYKW
ncbi:UvrD-helicase domain-containing protein [Clostridium magnum]|uniref:DNA 3'-5' helicase n=1 Tax=Clostridium magnum DSM 2767 TaxID=1121326 RepID=A0A161W0G7_9CLOT|nr:ATP-dependent helicase [Clostridium magnum]KZL88590.1 ATP-dependent DNA helicase PcrA [Clostridium magnum DSM 2767]SHI83874.1 DNA helicase-2 / ATP-dependent DNA helicase PcrA [Clostridium magnum DSM 2767]